MSTNKVEKILKGFGGFCYFQIQCVVEGEYRGVAHQVQVPDQRSISSNSEIGSLLGSGQGLARVFENNIAKCGQLS